MMPCCFLAHNVLLAKVILIPLKGKKISSTLSPNTLLVSMQALSHANCHTMLIINQVKESLRKQPWFLLGLLLLGGGLDACNWLAPEPAVSGVEVYPQPFNSTFVVAFQLERSAEVAFRLYAAPLPCGFRDPEVYAQRLDAGPHSIQIGCADFPRGVYEADLLVDGAPYRLQLICND
jgi:hypothetical protein